MAIIRDTDRKAVKVHDGTIYVKPSVTLGGLLALIPPDVPMMEALHRPTSRMLTALMDENIVGWEGKGYDGVEVTPENIRALDLKASMEVATFITDQVWGKGEEEGKKGGDGSIPSRTGSGQRS